MLAGLGFSPFYAAGICLLANTAPVAFGSIATPIVTLAGITGLPLDRLSAGVGRVCAPVSLIVPAYLVMVMGGWPALRGVLPAAAVCGIAFAGTILVSNFIGRTHRYPQLARRHWIARDPVQLWKPKPGFKFDAHSSVQATPPRHPTGALMMAWAPYLLLVIFVLLWGYKPIQMKLNTASQVFTWPGLHNVIVRMPPVVAKPAPYGAPYTFNWLSAPGTACLFAALLAAALLRMPFPHFFRVFRSTVRQLLLAELTIAAVLALAFLMNYSGATATLGLAFAATGVLFPFFSALLGWLGVFLTGSDTAANALFGNLQVVTAQTLHMNPVLMASSNSAGGVMGKMLSLQSVAVASCATAMKSQDEGRLFRFTLKLASCWPRLRACWWCSMPTSRRNWHRTDFLCVKGYRPCRGFARPFRLFTIAGARIASSHPPFFFRWAPSRRKTPSPSMPSPPSEMSRALPLSNGRRTASVLPGWRRKISGCTTSRRAAKSNW
jgi:lactate permease